MQRILATHGIWLCLLLPTGAQAAPTHRCAAAAAEQAVKLLAFHHGADDRIAVDAKSARRVGGLRNPADRSQTFDVLEVWGYIYKGQYRMRFIYAQLPGECVLMGQEILEYARL